MLVLVQELNRFAIRHYHCAASKNHVLKVAETGYDCVQLHVQARPLLVMPLQRFRVEGEGREVPYSPLSRRWIDGCYGLCLF